jgi:hypothetical protein
MTEKRHDLPVKNISQHIIFIQKKVKSFPVRFFSIVVITLVDRISQSATIRKGM